MSDHDPYREVGMDQPAISEAFRKAADIEAECGGVAAGRPSLPAGTVALLLEAADCIDGLLGQVAWTSDRHTEYCEPLAARLRAEAGKGEGTT